MIETPSNLFKSPFTCPKCGKLEVRDVNPMDSFEDFDDDDEGKDACFLVYDVKCDCSFSGFITAKIIPCGDKFAVVAKFANDEVDKIYDWKNSKWEVSNE